MIRGHHIGERRHVVTRPAAPGHVPKVETVVDAVVGEGRKVLLVDRVPEPKLGCDPAVEEAENIEPVGAFRRRREAEQLARLQMLEDPRVAGSGRVVELVDHDHVEVISVERIEAGGVEALHRREHVLEPTRASIADPQLTERSVAHRMLVGREALFEDLLAVGDEEKPRAR